MDYGELIRRAFTLTWRNKSLWVFGLLAGFGVNTQFSVDGPGADNEALALQLQDIFGDPENIQIVTEQLLALVGGAVILMLVFFFTHLIASPALVDAVNKLARGGVYRFGESFSRGVDFFFRELGLVLLGIGGAIAIIILGTAVLVLPIVVFPLLAIISVPVGIVVFLVGLFIWINILYLSERALVVRDTRVGDAVEEGYLLVRRHTGRVFIFFLLNLGLGIGIGIGAAILFTLLSLPAGFMSALAGGSWLAGFVATVLVFWPVSVVLGGWSGSFLHALYTLFYFALVEPGSPPGGTASSRGPVTPAAP